MTIEIIDEYVGRVRYTVNELAAIAPRKFPVQERVSGVTGNAFDWPAWYEAWIRTQQAEPGRTPTRLEIEGADEFQAGIPWSELEQALVLYEQEDGSPLAKGYPIRLYVPGGSSECLNVKSVVRIRILYAEEAAEKAATYGFKNTITPEQLLKPRS
ncbi:hypothetical protein [Paenibacillus elgii]|uniref:Oxidoreductase molybdopterin-binding domain-containing protein n=1 Tax=Paenibacillus elgii TaxID=189691 RepID=A0A163YD56_9BACL|nr:hypothetical protein [Paenibacillus elgii]KZE79237.1 hypothetical protein AV654_17330 [Paenibacillus elgii]NEN86751.1 hypothetical protein [Paenibacillus elgii]